MVRFLGFAVIALVAFSGAKSFGYEQDIDESELVTGCFQHVESAITRVNRKLDSLQGAAIGSQTHGAHDLARAARHASSSMDKFLERVGATCEKDVVRIGYNNVRGKVKLVQQIYNQSLSLKGDFQITRHMGKLVESWHELEVMINAL